VTLDDADATVIDFTQQILRAQALTKLRESGDASMFERDSWQEEMVATCRSQLAIESRAGRSILFYSQLPNGAVDRTSLHGGCPVMNGTKVSILHTFSSSLNSSHVSTN
jgi:hypothetical protein